MIQHINLSDLHAHPGNPRLVPREDVIEQIAAQLYDQDFDEAHALLVRPNSEGYQIISGHNRKIAAERAKLNTVPCWVRDMSDEEAYMALATCNAQGELSPLERGMHAFGAFEKGKHGRSLESYAVTLGRPVPSIKREVYAAEVAKSFDIERFPVINDRFSQLVEIHAAPEWLWPELVEAMLPPAPDKDGWTVETTRKQVGRFAKLESPPEWVNVEAFAKSLLAGESKTSDIPRFQNMATRTEKTLQKGGDDAERLIEEMWKTIKKRRPKLLSELEEICVAIEDEQRALIAVRRQGDLLRVARQEQIQARISRLRRSVSLTEWNQDLQPDERDALLALTPSDVEPGSFNPQESLDIEWAMFSWNPVSGCLHDCPYCYARDIAHQEKMAAIYPYGFAPTLHPAMLLAPRRAKPPKEAIKDARYKNVFTCSMADLFGRWVPNEWIEAVLREIREAPQWNFLCLTKFPKRMAEFDIPPNTWMGTTVDVQARVPAAEAAFAKINASVKWVSIEPMLEPIEFTRIELFDWIVVGGSSPQSETPAWYPPSEWLYNLHAHAQAAGVAWYEKTNLWGQTIRKDGEIVRPGTPRTTELPCDLPVIGDSYELPDVFKYLGRAKTTDQKAED